MAKKKVNDKDEKVTEKTVEEKLTEDKNKMGVTKNKDCPSSTSDPFACSGL